MAATVPVFRTWRRVRRLGNLASARGLRGPDVRAFIRDRLMRSYPGLTAPQAEGHLAIVRDGGPWPIPPRGRDLVF